MTVGEPYPNPRQATRTHLPDWLVRVAYGHTKRFRGPHAERDARAFYAEHAPDPANSDARAQRGRRVSQEPTHDDPTG